MALASAPNTTAFSNSPFFSIELIFSKIIFIKTLNKNKAVNVITKFINKEGNGQRINIRMEKRYWAIIIIFE